jgi:1,2-diacylglycerol 3-beta-galactosyltransferase
MKIVPTRAAALWLLSLGTASAFQPSSVNRHAVVRPSLVSKHIVVNRPLTSSHLQPTHLHSTTASNDEEIATIQILMSDTGGGHRASANALRDAFNVLHETEPARFPLKIHCDIVDIYTDYGPFWPYNSYVPLYKIMAEYSFLWKWFYEFGATPLGLWLNEFMLELTCFEPFQRCLTRDPMNIESNNKRADMVISVHPLCQDLPLKILNSLDTKGASRKEGRTTPFVTVVTDLGGAHPTWFNDGVDKCFVPSDVLKNAALDRSVKEHKIVQYGLPIRRGFWRFGADYSGAPEAQNEAQEMEGVHHKPTIREQLGLLDLPTVLIVGGGDGMGGIVSQAQAVGEKLQKLAGSSSSDDQLYQMVVVCGNNKSAQSSLSPPQTVWGKNVAVNVQGFVNNMDEYMRASDILVTKAGPGTIAEASICGLPCILSSFLPGQEEGNVPYVEESGFGCYQGSVEGIAETVEEWLASTSTTTEGSVLELMRENALSAARPDATLDIARDLADMVYKRKEDLRK